jgi:transcriptional regulator with XRE-family HTH domain
MNTVTVEESEKLRIVSQNIQKLIDVRGWTWSELAIRADVKQPTISRIKNAQFEPGIFTMRKIAVALNTSVDWICDDHGRILASAS